MISSTYLTMFKKPIAFGVYTPKAIVK